MPAAKLIPNGQTYDLYYRNMKSEGWKTERIKTER
jgi:hypothetical protein